MKSYKENGQVKIGIVDMPSLQHKGALPAKKEEVARTIYSFDAKADQLIHAMFHQEIIPSGASRVYLEPTLPASWKTLNDTNSKYTHALVDSGIIEEVLVRMFLH